MELSEEKRLAHNAYMREWKRKNNLKVNAINRAVKAKRPDLYREINRVSMQKKRDEDPERFAATNLRYRKKDPARYFIQHARARAKQLGVPFDLVEADIVIPEVCPVLGLRLEFGRGQMGCRNWFSPSLDRLVPEKGYVRGNVRVISNRANHVKGNGTTAEHRAVADYIEREVGITWQSEWQKVYDVLMPGAKTESFTLDFAEAITELAGG